MDKEEIKASIAEIIYQAFKDKIKYFWFWTDNKTKALDLIQKGLDLSQVCTLTNDQGQIVACATIETANSGLAIDLSYKDFRKSFNPLTGLVRQIVYTIYKGAQKTAQEDEVYVDLAAVSPNFRSQGYGGQLFEKLETLCQEKQKNKLSLDVVDSNQAAKSFYERIGFEQVGYEQMNILFRQFTKKAGFAGVYTMTCLLYTSPSPRD